MKVAVHVVLAFNATVPLAQPVPLHPANVQPLAGVAVSATDVPGEKLALQVAPQLIPAGLDVTVPLPLVRIVSVYEVGWAARLNVAVHAILAFNVTVPLAQPVPLQPENWDPLAGVAVSATTVPAA